jgi:predicted transporter
MVEAFERPGPTSLMLLAATLILIVVGVWVAKKWAEKLD